MLTLFAVLLVQALAVAAAWLLRARERELQRRLPYLLSLALGVLLATALLHLLPESVAALGNRSGLWLAVGGTLLALFAAERLFYAASSRSLLDTDICAQPEHNHGEAQGSALRPHNLMFGSSLHSFVDGTAIATAFLVNPKLGLLSAFAVALHEVPHRLGDVAVLLHFGVPAGRAMRFAVLVGVPSLLGAAAVLILGHSGAGVFRWLLPVSAGSFLYIAGVNLLPELPLLPTLRGVCFQLLCLAAGLGLVLVATGVENS